MRQCSKGLPDAATPNGQNALSSAGELAEGHRSAAERCFNTFHELWKTGFAPFGTRGTSFPFPISAARAEDGWSRKSASNPLTRAKGSQALKQSQHTSTRADPWGILLQRRRASVGGQMH